jgi:uncharacterized protein (TIGR03437 family)
LNYLHRFKRTYVAVLVAGYCLAPAPVAKADVTTSNVITTFAGAEWVFPGDRRPGRLAPISAVEKISTDRDGNIIIADTGNHVVSRLERDGTITVLAGNGIAGFSGDGGPAKSAALDRPSDAVMDQAGNLYIYDAYNYRIRRVGPDGIISTFAGNGLKKASGSTGEGQPATQAALSLNGRMAVDANGNLYFTDASFGIVRRIGSDGLMRTIAGNGVSEHSGENVNATDGGLGIGTGSIIFDRAGNLYVVESISNQIRKITPDGILTTFAGTGDAAFKDGPAASAKFDLPSGIAIDAAGNFYVGDVNNEAIRKITPDGIVSTIAGSGDFGFKGDGGPATSAVFQFPYGVALDSAGNLYVTDTGNFRIRRIDGNGVIDTVAGNGGFRNSPDGTPAGSAYLFGPNGISFDSAGNMLIADTSNAKVRRVSKNGTIQTIAGIGARGSGFIGGPATGALLDTVRAAVADAQGNVYIADSGASVVYRVKPDGTIEIFAGELNVYDYYGDDGPATEADLDDPFDLAIDRAGNVYIADSSNNVIRKVSTNGTITTFAGTGDDDFYGDNGLAVDAGLSGPDAIEFDPQGNLIIADTGNNRLRKVTPAGIITTIAGGGSKTPVDGTPATQAQLDGPFDLAVDSAGNIFYIDGNGSVVHKISNGLITAVAGNGKIAFAGDGGPAGQASFDGNGLAVDPAGNLYVSDFSFDRIHVVLSKNPSVSVAPGSLSFSVTSGGAITDKQNVKVSSSLAGLVFTVTSDNSWLQVPSGLISAPSNIQVAADPTGLQPGRYTAQIKIASPGTNAVLSTVSVTLTVNGALPAKLSIEPGSLAFSFNAGAAAQTQNFRVVNAGSGSLDFSISGITGSGSSSLKPGVRNGNATAGAPATVALTVDASSLSPGTYSSVVSIQSNAAGQSANLPVTITVAPRPQRLVVSQRGLLFTAVQGGGVTPPQTFAVLNAGDGSFSWSAKTIALTGPSWLSISTDSGTSDASLPPPGVTVTVDPTGLTPGQYYGIVRISSSGASNAPQDVEVVLNLLSSDSNPGALVGPSGLVFTGVLGGTNPGSQTFQITNLNPNDARYSLNTLTLDRGGWLTAAPDHGTIPGAGSVSIIVQPDLKSLTAGVYIGSINVLVEDVPRTVSVLLVVAPGGSAGSKAERAADGCTPTRLLPLFTSILQDFSVPAGWPLPVEVRVVDDCGTPLTSGRVSVSFSNGDPQVPLNSLRDGRWQGTWFGKNGRASQLSITANSEMDSPALRGSTVRTGNLQINTDIPTVDSGGIKPVTASAVPAVLSPGSLVTVTGKNLAAGSTGANQLPLGIDLGGTQILMAGRQLPLVYSSGGLVTAVIPYDFETDAQYPLLVMRGGAVSGPEMVTVPAAQPSILRIDATGGANVAKDIWSRLAAGTPIDPASIAPNTPVKAGDNLVIYCTGLGAVDQTLDSAMPAPADPVNAKTMPTVTVGGQSATPTFAGLVPGFTGMYQIKVVVPGGVAAGNNVPLVVSTLGQSSAAIGITVR